MELIQAAFLGIVEGLTEFLPISSTGHLIIASELIGFYDAARIFTIVIQLGAIAAVIWFYRKDLYEKTSYIFLGQKNALLFWRNIVVATLPAAVAGLLLERWFDSYSTLPIIALALILGGIVILIIETKVSITKSADTPRIDALTLRQSLQIGLYQITALIPGVSRSGATIMGGLLSGLDRVTATAFSFYLSIPVIVAAGLYKLTIDRNDVSTIAGGIPALLIGTLVSFITAFAAISWLLKYVATHDFKPFAYYRIILGTLLLLVLTLR